jgi:hypothetical protein
MNKDEIIFTFIDALKNSFVSQFDKIDYARVTVNQYMKDIEFNYIYDYNTFCIDFIYTVENILKSLDERVITDINMDILIYETLSIMIKNKIFDSITDEGTKQKLMILHELKKYLIKNNK